MAYTIQAGDTLGQIATTNQTDVATLQQLNPQITNPNLIIAGQSLNLPTIAPVVPATPITIQSIQQGLNDVLKGFGGTLNTQTGQVSITAENLNQNLTPLQVPTQTSTLGTQANAMVAGVQERLKAQEALKTPEQTIEEDKVTKMISDIEAKYATLEGKPTYAAEQYQLAGATPEAKKAITDVKSQIAAKTAEFNAIEADYMRAVQATEKVPGTTTGIVAGQQRELAKDLAYQRTANAAQIGILQASQLALTGAYNDAIEIADQAVELKYGTIKEQIDLRLEQIKLIKEELTAKEKKITDAMEAYLTEQKTKIEIQTANEKDLNATKLDIISKYNVGQMTDSLDTLIQKKLQSPVYKKEIQASGTTLKGNLLTLNEAKLLGLPTSLVGMSEEEVGQDLDSSTPPQWFKQMAEEKAQMSLTSDVLQKLWNEFRSSVKSGSTTTPAKSKLDQLEASL